MFKCLQKRHPPVMNKTAESEIRETLRRPLLPALAGGALWIPYGVLEVARPWGVDTRYDEALGYDIVVDRALHHVTSLPGSLALLLCAVGLRVLLRRLHLDSATARATSWGAGALAVVSAAGVVVSFDPVFTAARILGTVLLGVSLLAAGSARGSADWRPRLLALGLLTLSLLLVWPLVFALEWLSPAAGATVIGLHGLAWVALGAVAATGELR